MSLISFFANTCLEYLLKEDLKVSGQHQEPPKNNLTPPWASDPEIFGTLCSSCGECVTSCEKNLIIITEDRLPVMDFSNDFCNFCGDCARSCPTDALKYNKEVPPWHIFVSINDNCLMRKKVLCQICQEQCDQEAIVFFQAGQNAQSPEILNDQCNGCGACFSRCPTDAVSFQQIDKRQSETVQRGD